MKRIAYFILVFMLVAGKIQSQTRIDIPADIQAGLGAIAESALDSLKFGDLHLFSIRLVVSPTGIVRAVSFSEGTEPIIKQVVTKAAKTTRINWKKLFLKNKVSDDLCLIVPVVYYIEVEEFKKMNYKEAMDRYLTAVTFEDSKDSGKSYLTVILKPIQFKGHFIDIN